MPQLSFLCRMFVVAAILAAFFLNVFPTTSARAQTVDEPLRFQALAAMQKAATFYRTKVGVRGGYVYYYSVDLKNRWGEGKAAPDVAFVQPPGTPTVGGSYLQAYRATKSREFLDAAEEAAFCLAGGQLRSGGWSQSFVIAGAGSSIPPRKEPYSSLDDGQTQSALRFLIAIDAALDQQNKRIHDSAIAGLDALLKAQFPIGAFPQGWSGPVAKHPIAQAKFPDYDWRTEGRLKNYWDYYTLNDGLCGTVADTLIAADAHYGGEKYKAALARLGDFLILAQMPEPQPAWCQQYNYEMIPIWARKFEPPAITGHESQDAVETLIKIARHTGEEKYLGPIPRALDYFKRCRMFDGKVARYYELKTNKPLFMDKNYQLTYDDSDAPSHYGWKQPQRFDRIAKEYESAVKGEPANKSQPKAPSEADVRRVIRELDAEGRWVSTYAGEGLVGQPKFENGFKYISSDVFARKMEILSDYVAATPKAP